MQLRWKMLGKSHKFRASDRLVMPSFSDRVLMSRLEHRNWKKRESVNQILMTFSPPSWLVRLLVWTMVANRIYGMQCFSCHGECHSAARCNCQTGVCDGDYCFTEKWSRENGVVIYKGCGKGRPRIGHKGQCEYQRYSDRVFCLCDDDHFCNDDGAKFRSPRINNATCLHCSGGPCNSRCGEGEYCYADFIKNQFGCAYGKPLVPFHYQGNDLQQTYVRPWPTCTSFRAGPGHAIAECACTVPLCNSPSNLRDQMYFDESLTPLLHCHSCAEEMLSESVLPSCRRQLCLGQYCAIKVESVFDPMANAVAAGSQPGGSGSAGSYSKSFRYKQWSGCLNTTRPGQVLRGTFQRWTVGTRQVTECVCGKDYCNLDVKSCMSSGTNEKYMQRMKCRIPVLLYFVFLLYAIT